MPLYQALVLGIVQGITEIFPVSSSGHLILVPALLGWSSHPLAFDAALHLGTALALLAFFFRDWLNLFLSRSWKVIAWIVVASVPAGLFGVLWGNQVENAFRGVASVAVALVAVAVLMFLVERIYRAASSHKGEASFGDILLIGFAQTLALIPGVSRSGITILTSMGRGLKRDRAAYFSFLISLPVTFAAGGWELLKVWREGMLVGQESSFAVGILTSFVVGFLAIRFLFGILRKHSLIPFAIYRIVLGILLLVAL